jgi:hypothetical protein
MTIIRSFVSFQPFPGFDPLDGEDPRVTYSLDNPVSPQLVNHLSDQSGTGGEVIQHGEGTTHAAA